MTQNTVIIGFLALHEAQDVALVQELTGLINDAYAQSEEGLWIDDAARTNTSEVAGFIAVGEIVVARVDGRIAGSVRVQRMSPSLGEFGMLVAAPHLTGAGVGRRLLEFVQLWAVENGLDELQLEVLTPREWLHPSKEFLRQWYTRIGFEQVRLDRFEDAYPALAAQLATPCDFVIYRKRL